VDNDNTRLYLRFYQSFVTLPLLGTGICWLSNLLNRYILDQDKRIVLTQEPRSTQLRMNEVLIPSDRPIIEYRKWRHANLKETP
jgi:phenylpropionate dioxygenase-like ring-hydroxylating dioxygenase large terminal subunit